MKLEEVGTALVDVRSLSLENLVETLALQRAARHREVDEGDARAEVGRELDGGVARREEDGEGRRQVNVLIAERDEHASARASQLAVEDGVENRVVVLDVLHEQRVAETKRTLQVLAEGVVQETETRTESEMSALELRTSQQRTSSW